MKKILIVFLIVFPSMLFTQNFAPIGAEWYYTEYHSFSQMITFLNITSVRDTVIKGKTCSVLENNHGLACNFYNERDFVYEEDSIAYFYSPVVDDFQILYNLKAKKDSSWTIIYQVENFLIDTVLVTVDSVRTVEINGFELLAFDVSYQSLNGDNPNSVYTSTIVERIGDLYYLFNFLSLAEGIICDGNYSGGLRCYTDTYIGFYSTGIADSCTYITNINEHIALQSFNVAPNPLNSSTSLYYELKEPSIVQLSIFNQLGQLVYQHSEKQEQGMRKLRWNAKDQPEGLYFYQLQAGDQQATGKLVKTK
ncbi:T9SS type A sorting domain-containing protein [bacterium]|nr:T9SS type A sorting domain-containing protein [bacterium]